MPWPSPALIQYSSLETKISNKVGYTASKNGRVRRTPVYYTYTVVQYRTKRWEIFFLYSFFAPSCFPPFSSSEFELRLSLSSWIFSFPLSRTRSLRRSSYLASFCISLVNFSRVTLHYTVSTVHYNTTKYTLFEYRNRNTRRALSCVWSFQRSDVCRAV
jgi:hypothetical protein